MLILLNGENKQKRENKTFQHYQQNLLDNMVIGREQFSKIVILIISKNNFKSNKQTLRARSILISIFFRCDDAYTKYFTKENLIFLHIFPMKLTRV